MKLYSLLALASALLISACAGIPSSVTQNYQCESGKTVAVSYRTSDTAEVDYKGNSYDMSIAVSGSGARYVGGGIEWWVKGSGSDAEGLLLKHRAGGSSGDILESCTAL
ncbi:MliC family protein [Marinobacter sp.]|uniref:MliC family protein n=1 Tax=Marinobacter sp. TaxID=50741 RepID=UPI002B2741BB|nr:MliC family protein [Marinobacter sp.]